jgi:hypothetical protein
MRKFTKRILLAGAILTVYGYVCRVIGIYFFWESKYIGWAIIIIGIISFLFDRVRLKKAGGKKSLLEKIGIGILIFFLFVQAILVIVIPNTDAYKVAKQYLYNNSRLKNDIGEIKGFALVPLGAIQKSSSENVESGNATILLTVKGQKKFMDVTVYIEKKPGMEWIVTSAE